jgi:biotin-dependent carboxylase-like uncharacterized protein
MSAALHVIEPGLLTTLQDGGRTGFQRFGMPVSGALDDVSRQVANVIVGNNPEDAALEIIGPGLALRIEAGRVRLAAAGSSPPLRVRRGGGVEDTVAPYRSFVLTSGDVLRLPAPRGGMVYYLAVEGGFDVAPVLGSVSTYLRASLGGFQGRKLQAGDVLPLRSGVAALRPEMQTDARAETPDMLRVISGPQEDAFTPVAADAFFASSWHVGAASDRMGLRLEGPKLAHRGAPELPSQGIAAGAIQVPGDGQPILLLADRQTTGGYPVIATVIGADVAAAGRLAPGMAVRFEAVSYDDALAARRDLATWLEDVAAGLQPVDQPFAPETLLGKNLIGGVTDGASDLNPA